MAFVQKSSNFDGFTKKIKFLVGLCGIKSDDRPTGVPKYFAIANLLHSIIVIILQILFLIYDKTSPRGAHFSTIIYLNYFAVTCGKLANFLLQRLRLVKIFEEFQKLSPSANELRSYDLEHYLKSYKKIEMFVLNFLTYILTLLVFQPLVESFVLLWKTGVFGYYLPLFFWPPIPERLSYLMYGIYYGSMGCSCVFSAFNKNVNDLCLISFLIQISARFDLLAKKISKIQPAEAKSVEDLIGIVKEHQRTMRLAAELQKMFAPSVTFTLCSTSLIMCLVFYKLLDDIPPMEVVKAFFLLCYEMKQIIIICFFANKLLDTSGRFFDAICLQNWFEGSSNYRRYIVFLLMSTRRPIGLRVGGIMTISLITLKQVLGNAYQIFALLKRT